MKLFCPACGSSIAAADIDLAQKSARCGKCSRQFSFDQRSALSSRGKTKTDDHSELVPRPARMRVEKGSTYCTISWRWIGPAYFGMLVFCIAWDSFLIFWYRMTLTHPAPWIAIVFPIGHLAVGIGMTYATLAGLLNRTRIQMDAHEMQIRHFPIPWWGNRNLLVSQLSQLYCECGSRKDQVSYSLSAVLRDGRRLKLFSVSSLADAKFLEQAIESYYHIAPRKVAGEVETATA